MAKASKARSSNISNSKKAEMAMIESIEDRFERLIATANLMSSVKDAVGAELADDTIPKAAFYMYRDLKQLHKDVQMLVCADERMVVEAG